MPFFLENELKVLESVKGIVTPKEHELSPVLNVDLTGVSGDIDHQLEEEHRDEAVVLNSDDEPQWCLK